MLGTVQIIFNCIGELFLLKSDTFHGYENRCSNWSLVVLVGLVGVTDATIKSINRQ